MIRVVRDVAVSAALALALVAACEGAVRVIGYLRTGAWPVTRASALYAVARERARLYRPHPYLAAAPREGTVSTVGGRTVSFNSLGYRSPERPLAKPPGTIRLLCAGGSTTFDLVAPDDEHAWPALLEERLRRRTPTTEVWNAGFPGWTSLENLIALALRDVDIHPDAVLLFQGINDLQPASHTPFDPQYADFHAGLMQRALGFGVAPPGWAARSVLWERVRGTVGFPDRPAETDGPRLERIPDQAVRTFGRNVRSFIAVASAHGALVALMTQPIHLHERDRGPDRATLEQWIPGLDPDAVPTEIERLNGVLRVLARSDGALLVDAARDVVWTDEDFFDPMHHFRPGAEKLAALLDERLEPILSSRPLR